MKPICAKPGCENRVKDSRKRWCCREHVPDEVRRAAGQKGRATFAYNCRVRLFRAELAQLTGRRLTREDLLVVFARIYQKGRTANRQIVYQLRQQIEDLRGRGARTDAA